MNKRQEKITTIALAARLDTLMKVGYWTFNPVENVTING
jgi:hypothetical protein